MAQRILGLDIGATAVRAAVVESTHHGPLVTATAREEIAAAVDGGPPLRERQLAAVRALLAAGPLAFDSAMVALPGSSATHVITLPFTDTRRIEQTIGVEVEAQIPFDLAEVAWDWQPLHVREQSTEILVAVVKKDELA